MCYIRPVFNFEDPFLITNFYLIMVLSTDLFLSVVACAEYEHTFESEELKNLEAHPH